MSDCIDPLLFIQYRLRDGRPLQPSGTFNAAVLFAVVFRNVLLQTRNMRASFWVSVIVVLGVASTTCAQPHARALHEINRPDLYQSGIILCAFVWM